MRLRELKDKLAVKAIRLLARAQGWIHCAAFGENVWVATDGTPYRYHELKDHHLRNIIRLLERRGETNTNTFRRLFAEQGLRRRGSKRRYRP